MYIQNYQIQNVLNVYRQQLSKRISGQSTQKTGSETGSEIKEVSNNNKNQSIMDKVAANVLKKITNLNSDTDVNRKETATGNKNNGPNRHSQEDKFTFNTIVDCNQKETRSISFNDSQGLMVQLNRLARAAIDHKTNGKNNSS